MASKFDQNLTKAAHSSARLKNTQFSGPEEYKYLEEGYRLQQQGRLSEAYQSFVNAVKFDSTCDQAYHILGIVLRMEKKFNASIICLKKAVKLNPISTEYHYELGESYRCILDWRSAEYHFKESVRLSPTNEKSWYNLAYIYSKSGRIEESENAIQHGLALGQFIVDLQSIRALNELSVAVEKGDYRLGFEMHEHRTICEGHKSKTNFPKWQGEKLANKFLYVEGEQGFGDIIQHIRFINLLPAKNIVVGVKDELRTICESSFPKVKFCSILNPPRCDYTIMMGSLAHMLDNWGKTPDTLPKLPYFHTDKIIPITRPKGTRKAVGICWAGNPEHLADDVRSSTLEDFFENLSDTGIELYSLQVAPKNPDPALLGPMGLVHDMRPYIKDFSDTAAIIKQLDCVVTVDTSMSHLAGALGAPCHIIIPFYAIDWRWGFHGNTSVWYPSMKVHRQGEKELFSDVLQRIKKEI